MNKERRQRISKIIEKLEDIAADELEDVSGEVSELASRLEELINS